MNELKQAELVDHLVGRIRRWGLVQLAITLLESAQPLAFIGGQILWLAQPAMSLFVSHDRLAGYARLLEEPEAIDLLRTRLEES